MKGLTDAAGNAIVAALERAKRPEEQCARFLVWDGRQRLMIDTERPSDKVFLYKGRKTLLVDPQTAQAFSGSSLDYKDGAFRLAY